MHEFSVTATAPGPAATVVVTGDVDLATADRLHTAVRPLVVPGSEIRVDCAGVQFLDSAGLRVLLALDRATHDVGAALVLTAPSDVVTRTLRLAGVAGVFTVHS
ncbi:STAS domain-containing protein [Catenulispora sp. NF23]|uniref:Anti-sigma factor antagonist n=1 Tax=Catenulispora pinistramenti TaxID=2705254 RepID=A0ABS5L7F4_9ACTN|nr:STAS domain-containing protein [Catenulispora pinistramenti]MBS2539344.1 STAS domain-containing protein [Catenulispora pinistramenti]MBS2554263.1 STAS domain-containing protein [Catenulispora pinistramenti]